MDENRTPNENLEDVDRPAGEEITGSEENFDTDDDLDEDEDADEEDLEA